MRSRWLACGSILLSVLPLTAHASPITITETVTASGTLGSSFSSQLVTLTGVGDTSNVTRIGTGLYVLTLTSATVQVDAGPVAAFTGTILAFDNQSAPAAGFSAAGLSDILDADGAAFGTYALNSSFAATGDTFISSRSFATTAGAFQLTQFDSVTGFTATVSPAATPEPSSLAFLVTGLVGLAGIARRRLGTAL